MVYKLAKKHFLKLIELNGSPTSIEVFSVPSHQPVTRHAVAIIWENDVVIPEKLKTEKIVSSYGNQVYTKPYKGKLNPSDHHITAIGKRNALESYKNAISFQVRLLAWLQKHSTEITDGN